MPILRVACPECAAGLKSAVGFQVGQKVRCPKCETRFEVEDPDEQELAPPKQKPTRAIVEELDDDEPSPPPKKRPTKVAVVPEPEDEDRPRPKRKPARAAVEDSDDDEDDDRPRKPKKKKKADRDDSAGSYKNSPIRFVILGILLIVLGVLGVMLYQKYQKKDKDSNVDVEKSDDDLSKPIDPSKLKGKGNPIIRPGANSKNNLTEIAIAIHNWAEANSDDLPPAAIKAGGKPMLSWRVLILPYIGQKDLYEKFKTDEPWDSPSNKLLIPKMPAVFNSSLAGATPGKTFFKALVGPNTAIGSDRSANLNRFPDGTSNTILILEAGEAVEWTKPEEITLDPAQPLPKLELPNGVRKIHMALCDGTVRILDLNKVKPETINAAATYNGGEILGKDW